MMQFSLKPITTYPFPLAPQNPITLTHTILASKQTSILLSIQHHGYRYLKSLDKQMLVLIVVDYGIDDNEERTLFVPYNVGKVFGGKCFVQRKALALKEELKPDLPLAGTINIYFNSSFKLDKFLLTHITKSAFICTTSNYLLDSLWFQKTIQSDTTLNSTTKIQISRIIQQSKLNNHHYFRIYLEVENEESKDGYFLFEPKTSTINIVKHKLHPNNIHKCLAIPELTLKIFNFSQYRKIQQQVLQSFLGKQSMIVLLEAQPDCNFQVFFENVCQNQMKEFIHLDCNNLVSSKQFTQKLSQIGSNTDSLVFIQHLQWIEQLFKSQGNESMQPKHIIRKVQENFEEICLESCNQLILVIQYQNRYISPDMIKKSIYLPFAIPKQTKFDIYKLIFKQTAPQCTQSQQLINMFHKKVPWKSFLHFMTHKWTKIEDHSISNIIKQIKKLIKSEQVENLIEVNWDDVGGLENAKEEIIQTIELPMKHPQIFDEWIRPRTGLLFYGPPGTGKTLLGKCIAKQCKMSFISVKGPQLLNMYVGQSQKNVREVFERAAASKPCIVFMDELDALIPKRGNSGDSNSVMDRIVAELLMQMDNATANQIFIIGATNRPDLLDPSILTPGRFDKQIYLGITSTNEDKIKIMKAQTRKLALDQNMDWQALIQHVPAIFTGADFYGLTSKAVMMAAERSIQEYQEREVKDQGQGQEGNKIVIKKEDFIEAIKVVKPSVTEADLLKYEQLKKVYS